MVASKVGKNASITVDTIDADGGGMDTISRGNVQDHDLGAAVIATDFGDAAIAIAPRHS